MTATTKSRVRVLMACMLVTTMLAGCGVQGEKAPASGTGTESPPVVEATPTPVTDVEKQEKEIVVFEADDQLLELVESKTKVTYGTDEELVTKAMEALQQQHGEKTVSLWNKLEIKSTKLEANQAIIDISIPDEARVGSSAELFTLEALKKTLFQFDFVHTIELLIDGEKKEDLMGHVELEHPMKRENN